ncbi:ribonuclease P [Methanosarcinales archaeon ex4572_44]|nr:MAG: ribonuclease P [Methanosarcinales archaeon ex4484_138]PHP45969.1 MAG: ribonuclease P [Methanosarcinales archaeon ex4572_44]RLG26319.1 MAG: ribonuclease P [Methanosarcinales archaeon]RLG28362.1 MAG: ribonuclease P [Methanosarcinales archaeon]
MKILPPTLREKKRYLTVEIMKDGRINRDRFLRALQDSIKDLFGDVGLSETGLRLLHFDGTRAVVRCTPKMVWAVRAGIATITQIDGVKVSVRVIGIGGTVRSVMEKYVETGSENMSLQLLK